MHPVARVLLIGSSGQESPLYKLNGQSDILGSIWQALVRTWTFELLEATLEKNDSVAFAHVQNVDFPEPKGRHVNMMPFVMGDVQTLPDNLRCYWPMIESCLRALPKAELLRVGYLTVTESEVPKGEPQRRGGLHTEGFMREACDASGGGGRCSKQPYWHRWGFGRAMDNGRFDGGIFVASSVSNSSQVYNVCVPPTLVGRGGDVEHLRPVLEGAWPDSGQPRLVGPKGGPAGSAHLIGISARHSEPASHPITLQAGQLFWMTDRTPHESLPLAEGGPRQFFRLVTSPVDMWYAAHATPNPLGVLPACAVLGHDKFTGALPAKEAAAPETAPPDTTAAAAAAAEAAAAPLDTSHSAVLRRMVRSGTHWIQRVGEEGLASHLKLRQTLRALRKATADSQGLAAAAEEAAAREAAAKRAAAEAALAKAETILMPMAEEKAQPMTRHRRHPRNTILGGPSKQAKQVEEAAALLSEAARCYLRAERWRPAAEAFERAASCHAWLQSADGEASALEEAAAAFRGGSDDFDAERCYQKAVALHEARAHYGAVARLHAAMGEYLERHCMLELEALKAYTRAAAAYEKEAERHAVVIDVSAEGAAEPAAIEGSSASSGSPSRPASSPSRPPSSQDSHHRLMSAMACREQGRRMRLRMAAMTAAAGGEDPSAATEYKRAADLFESAAVASLEERRMAEVNLPPPPLLSSTRRAAEASSNAPWRFDEIDSPLLHAALCRLALAAAAEEAPPGEPPSSVLARCEGVDAAFAGTYEGRFLRAIVEACEADSALALAEACSNYDEGVRGPLSPLLTSLLLRVKRGLTDTPHAESS